MRKIIVHLHQEIPQILKRNTCKFQILQITWNSIQKSSAPLWPWNHWESFFFFLFKKNSGFHYFSFALTLNLFWELFSFQGLPKRRIMMPQSTKFVKNWLSKNWILCHHFFLIHIVFFWRHSYFFVIATNTY